MSVEAGAIVALNAQVKLLVFAHKPPPHHGQSYMVQLLLEALGNDLRREEADAAGPSPSSIRCYHVDARLSDSLGVVGRFQWKKLFLALRYCGAAIWIRLRRGVRCLYYIPAPPGLRPALYRDFMILGLCRPFFRQLVYHWHAVGLGDWLETQAKPWERWLGRLLLGRPALSMVLAEFNRRDAQQLNSHRIHVVPNGIPDPCPRFEQEVLPQRRARVQARRRLLDGGTAGAEETLGAGPPARVFQVLFLGLCFRQKGLFDALEAVVQANHELRGTPLRMKLVVGGTFWLESERAEFEQRLAQPDVAGPEPQIEYHGFVTGEAKARLLRESDCLCFPTYYPAESFGLVLVEAMAYGLPLVTTRWRMIPELLPPGYPGLVDPQSPSQVAAALVAVARRDYDPALRRHFLDRFTDGAFAQNLQAALRTLEV